MTKYIVSYVSCGTHEVALVEAEHRHDVKEKLLDRFPDDEREDLNEDSVSVRGSLHWLIKPVDE